MASGTIIQGFFPRGLSSSSPAAAQLYAAQRHSPNATIQQLSMRFGTFRTNGGDPLSAAVRQKMEAVFGTGFSDVRVHIDPRLSALGALAVTHGSHIHFAPGRYSPTTAQGQHLLGHELTHVVQQRANRVRNVFGNGIAVVRDALLDAEAMRMAERAARPFMPVVQPKRVIQRVTEADLAKWLESNGTPQNDFKQTGMTSDYVVLRSADVTVSGRTVQLEFHIHCPTGDASKAYAGSMFEVGDRGAGKELQAQQGYRKLETMVEAWRRNQRGFVGTPAAVAARDRAETEAKARAAEAAVAAAAAAVAAVPAAAEIDEATFRGELAALGMAPPLINFEIRNWARTTADATRILGIHKANAARHAGSWRA
jgi:hypothetical protein